MFGNPGQLDRPIIGGVRFGIELPIRGHNCLAGYFPNTCIGDVNRFENFSVGSSGVSNRSELVATTGSRQDAGQASGAQSHSGPSLLSFVARRIRPRI